MNQEIPIPQTCHAGLREHFCRAGLFYNAAMTSADHVSRFRILMASVYSCRAISELMLECADRGELNADRSALKKLLTEKLPYFGLLERIRIHDFHRFGLTPPPSANVHMTMGMGPIKLKPRNGVAAFQLTPTGPKITCTGNSSVVAQRPLFRHDGSFFDDATNAYVPLEKVVKDYLVAVPAAVAEFETLVTTPPIDDCGVSSGAESSLGKTTSAEQTT